MRELKFRAWNTTRNCFTSRVELDLLYEKPMLLHGEFENDNGYLIDNTIIEQYTGLKDKNGKEIYEGDIVGFEWTKRLYVVTYRIYDASFILENDEWEETIHLSLEKDDFEVFGNIHENPELLEEE